MTLADIVFDIFSGMPVTPLASVIVAIGCLGVLLWIALGAADEKN